MKTFVTLPEEDYRLICNCLGFYSDPKNWELKAVPFNGQVQNVINAALDGGQRAKEVLEHLSEIKNDSSL